MTAACPALAMRRGTATIGEGAIRVGLAVAVICISTFTSVLLYTADQTVPARASTGKAEVARCPDARHGLIFYRTKHANWRERRGLETVVSLRQPKGCAHAQYVASAWREKARLARQSFHEWWRWVHTLREQRTWLAAVEHVQRPYPNTRDWLLSCSGGEGGHGHWKPNREGSGAGGWMQFMHGTFVWMSNAAIQDVTRRGYKVQPELASWYSRTGQALAGAWGFTHGESDHWEAGSC